MPSSILLVAIFFLKLWFLLSPIVFIWLFCDGTRRNFFKKKYEFTYMLGSGVVFVGAFFFLTIALSSGIEQFLSFIPDSWGSVDEDGTITTGSKSWSYSIGGLLALFISVSYNYLNDLRNKVFIHQQIIIKAANKIQDVLRHTDSEKKTTILTKLHIELNQYLLSSDSTVWVNDGGYIRPEVEQPADISG